jgi:hypothetical protein
MTPAAITAFLDGCCAALLLASARPDDVAASNDHRSGARSPEATRRCVQSLLALDYPADHREIIVVDDASNATIG